MTLHTLSRTRGSGSFALFGLLQIVSYLPEIRDASRLIQEPEPGDNKFAVQFQELQQLDVDVLVDYCSPVNQRAVPKGDR